MHMVDREDAAYFKRYFHALNNVIVWIWTSFKNLPLILLHFYKYILKNRPAMVRATGFYSPVDISESKTHFIAILIFHPPCYD